MVNLGLGLKGQRVKGLRVPQDLGGRILNYHPNHSVVFCVSVAKILSVLSGRYFKNLDFIVISVVFCASVVTLSVSPCSKWFPLPSLLEMNTHIHQNPPQFPPIIKRRRIILNQILFLVCKVFCGDAYFRK